jgi:hypothetical protein
MNNPETQARLGTRQCFTKEALVKTKGTVKTVPLVFSKASFVKHCRVPNVVCVSGLFMLDSPFGFL